MPILLDTQALTWALNDSRQLTITARQFIRESDIVYVSPINFYEIAIKMALGKDPGIKPPIHEIIEKALLSGYLYQLITLKPIYQYLSSNTTETLLTECYWRRRLLMI